MTSWPARKALVRPCPICGGSQGEVIHTQRFVLPEGHPLAAGYDVVSCLSCGFCFADTGAGQSEYDAFYARASRYADGKTSTGGGIAAWDAGRLRDTAAQVARHVPERRARIADVGCATGGLLRAFSELGYGNLVGIDPSPDCVAQAGAVAGTAAFVGSLSELPPELGEFDCVVLSHVLEHVRDLRPALAGLRVRLRPGGRLYVETPDAARYVEFVSAPFQEFNTEHINHFSVQSLENLLARSGFASVDRGVKTILSGKDTEYPAAYVFGVAAPGIDPDASALARDDETAGRLAAYVRVSRRTMDEIDGRLRHLLAATPEVVVWGTGQLAMKLLAETALGGARIAAFVDGSPVVQGQTLRGVPILAPRQMEPSELPIVVASILHHAAIVADIRALGLTNPVFELRPAVQTTVKEFSQSGLDEAV